MEGERSASGLHLNPNYELQASFTAPHAAITEMGFVQFEDHHQVLSFLAPSSQSSQLSSQPLGGGGDNNHTTCSTTNNNTGSLGFNSHNEIITTRPSWNNDQVGSLVGINVCYTQRSALASTSEMFLNFSELIC